MHDNNKIYPQRREGIKATLLPDGHLVLFDPATDWAHTLNPLGAIVWEYCDGKTDLASIGNIVCTLTQKTEMLKELSDLVQELESYGLLSKKTSAGNASTL